MDAHFRAFSFVDRIVTVEPGMRIRGAYTVPAGLQAFPPSLVAEAVGQLAAWSAMAAVDFQSRPVAGIAGEVHMLAPVQPGQVLDLSAELETVDADAVAYGGRASVDGRTVLRLERCVGPMVPLTDFDDPALVRERYKELQDSGVSRGNFDGIPPIAVERTGGEPGVGIRAVLHVPEQASLFADHFPRRPVFPGTLLMQAKLQLVSMLASEVTPPRTGGSWTPAVVRDVKLRTFIPPGDHLDLQAKVESVDVDGIEIVCETRRGNRRAGGARVRIAADAAP